MDPIVAFLEDYLELIIAVFLAPLVKWLYTEWRKKREQKQQSLSSRIGLELFRESEIRRAIRYYIEPDSSPTDPSTKKEAKDVPRFNEIPLFRNLDIFLNAETEHCHMLILADSGMGKTSALLNYYFYNKQKPLNKQHHIVVVPLGAAEADKYIQDYQTQHKDNLRQTVLCLDAFDEDSKAIGDYRIRINTLMDLGKNFAYIILTSRTQFFLSDKDLPSEIAIEQRGAVPANVPKYFTFWKLYLLPFTDKQVVQYIHKRYSFWQQRKRSLFQNAVIKVPKLQVRPMLLAHIPELIAENKIDDVKYSYELYEILVEAWFKREKRYNIDINDLREFSRRMAVDIHVNHRNRDTEYVHYTELSNLAQEWNIPLAEWELTSRSLLNRDAEGYYKFAHRSIMEYIFICANTNDLEIQWQDIEWTGQMQEFVEEMIDNRAFCSLKTLTEANLNGCDFSQVEFKDINLFGANLFEANLFGTDLSQAILEQVNLTRARFDKDTKWPIGFAYQNSGAIGPNANLSNMDLSGADLSETDLSGSKLDKARFDEATKWPIGFDYQNSGAIGPNANLSNIDISGINLSNVDLSDANLNGCNLYQAIFDKETKWPVDFDYRNSGAIGPSANLSGVDISDINLLDIDLSGARFDKETRWPIIFDYRNSGAIGPNANLKGVILLQVDLCGVDLSGANITGANLFGAFFDGETKWPAGFDYRNSGAIGPNANLKGANLSPLNLTRVNLCGAQYDKETRWPHKFSYENSGAIGPKANLEGIDLSNTDISNVDIRKIRYNKDTIWPAGFDYQNSGAIGPNANLVKVTLSGHWTKVDLSNANLSNANLSRANLSGATLSGTNLSRVNFSGTNLSNANLSNANLNNAKYNSRTKWPNGFDYESSGAIYR